MQQAEKLLNRLDPDFYDGLTKLDPPFVGQSEKVGKHYKKHSEQGFHPKDGQPKIMTDGDIDGYMQKQINFYNSKSYQQHLHDSALSPEKQKLKQSVMQQEMQQQLKKLIGEFKLAGGVLPINGEELDRRISKITNPEEVRQFLNELKSLELGGIQEVKMQNGDTQFRMKNAVALDTATREYFKMEEKKMREMEKTGTNLKKSSKFTLSHEQNVFLMTNKKIIIQKISQLFLDKLSTLKPEDYTWEEYLTKAIRGDFPYMLKHKLVQSFYEKRVLYGETEAVTGFSAVSKQLGFTPQECEIIFNSWLDNLSIFDLEKNKILENRSKEIVTKGGKVNRKLKIQFPENFAKIFKPENLSVDEFWSKIMDGNCFFLFFFASTVSTHTFQVQFRHTFQAQFQHTHFKCSFNTHISITSTSTKTNKKTSKGTLPRDLKLKIHEEFFNNHELQSVADNLELPMSELKVYFMNWVNYPVNQQPVDKKVFERVGKNIFGRNPSKEDVENGKNEFMRFSGLDVLKGENHDEGGDLVDFAKSHSNEKSNKRFETLKSGEKQEKHKEVKPLYEHLQDAKQKSLLTEELALQFGVDTINPRKLSKHGLETFEKFKQTPFGSKLAGSNVFHVGSQNDLLDSSFINELKHGDLVVVGEDGKFFEKQNQQLVEISSSDNSDLKPLELAMAKEIGNKAHEKRLKMKGRARDFVKKRCF